MTVREWIARRSPRAPADLQRQVLAALGSDQDADAARTADLCLLAAERALRDILATQRFERSGALDLLAVDALATYAYEHASEVGDEHMIARLADEGLRRLGRVVDAGV